ncbi:GbsR/MarR family transcriptional regulator [Halioxenophilus aromaticivorans]|uniref:HTH-type transcriptional regulator n=1 Tax=Halioxenophilus aromaticivorans TaxID=1306992 RepID=A0AAV3U4H3_9ALTE
MQLSDQVQDFVLHFGEMGSCWGFNRTVGQLFALIVITEQPLCADDLAQALSVSRGNVSMGLKELQAWRLIKPVHKPGDRKEYYQPAGDVWQLGATVLEVRRKRELDPTLSLLRDLLIESSDKPTDDHAKAKMQEIHDVLEMLAGWVTDLQSMNPDKLRTLMKLGSGIGKVLDVKDRLLNKPKDEH